MKFFSKKRVMLLIVLLLFFLIYSFIVVDTPFYDDDFLLLSIVNGKVKHHSYNKWNAYHLIKPSVANNKKCFLPWFTQDKYKTSNFRPVASALLVLENEVFKNNHQCYRIISILLQFLIAVMIYMLALKILSSQLSAFLALLVFTLHSFNLEVAISLFEQCTQLSMLFGLLSFLFYIKYREKVKLKYFFLSMILLVIAILSKEIAVILPVIFFFYDLFYIKEKELKLKSFIGKNFIIYLIFILIGSLVVVLYVINNYGQTHGHNYLTRGPIAIFVMIYNVLLYSSGLILNTPAIPIKASFFPYQIFVFILSVVIYVPLVLFKNLRTKAIKFFFYWILISVFVISPMVTSSKFVFFALIGFSFFAGEYLSVLLKWMKKKWILKTYLLLFKIVIPVLVSYVMFNYYFKTLQIVPQNNMIASFMKIENKIPRNSKVYLLDTAEGNASWNMLFGVRLYSKSGRRDYCIYPLTNFRYKSRLIKYQKPCYRIKVKDKKTIIVKANRPYMFFSSIHEEKYLGSRDILRETKSFYTRDFHATLSDVSENHVVTEITYTFNKPLNSKNQVFLKWDGNNWIIKKFTFSKSEGR